MRCGSGRVTEYRRPVLPGREPAWAWPTMPRSRR